MQLEESFHKTIVNNIHIVCCGSLSIAMVRVPRTIAMDTNQKKEAALFKAASGKNF